MGRIRQHTLSIIIPCAFLCACICACSSDDCGDGVDAFKAGFAVVDITPGVDVRLAGYGSAFISDSFCRWSTGVHDPLYAHAVAFDDRLDGKALILIVLDNVGTITNEVKEIQAGVAGALGLAEESIVVSATHTHHGPDTIGLWGVIIPPITGRQEDVIDMMVAGAIEAGIDAWNARVPARLEYAVGEEPRFHFNKITGDPDATIDSTMTVLAAYDRGGRLIGSLMNWAAHPTLLADSNTLISADYPGAYYKHMGEALDGIHMFVNGAIGASIQVLAVENGWWKWLFSSAGWEDWDDFGIALTEDVTALMANAVPIDEPSIGLLESREVQAKVENLMFWLAATIGLIPREVPPVGEYGTTFMTTFAIGPVTFGTVPGEYVPDYSFNLREVMGGQAQFVIGLGMDWIGYAITPDQYQKPQYLYERFLCPSSMAGEELLDVYREIWDPAHEE
ncbi:neutral/alkaline non-lysosomal ceramidase N-terminal domain-containing protein [Thermodesulfobacteriota bacterium]